MCIWANFKKKTEHIKSTVVWIIKMQRHLSSQLYNEAQIKKWKDFENLTITFIAC